MDRYKTGIYGENNTFDVYIKQDVFPLRII